MTTMKERIQNAFQINQIALEFAKHYFSEYAFILQLQKNNKKLPPSYFEDDVSVASFDEDGEIIQLKYTYDVGSYGNYDEHTEYVTVPAEVLERFISEPAETINQFVTEKTEVKRKQLEKIKLEEQKRKEHDEMQQREQEYRNYLLLKSKYDPT
jgi:hypothetical protein